MDNAAHNRGAWDLKELNAKIAEIEKCINELRIQGAGLPAVEKNARSMLNCIYVLKFGIADILASENDKGGPAPGKEQEVLGETAKI